MKPDDDKTQTHAVLTKGTYTIEVEVEYSTAGRTERLSIGSFEEM